MSRHLVQNLDFLSDIDPHEYHACEIVRISFTGDQPPEGDWQYVAVIGSRPASAACFVVKPAHRAVVHFTALNEKAALDAAFGMTPLLFGSSLFRRSETAADHEFGEEIAVIPAIEVDAFGLDIGEEPAPPSKKIALEILEKNLVELREAGEPVTWRAKQVDLGFNYRIDGEIVSWDGLTTFHVTRQSEWTIGIVYDVTAIEFGGSIERFLHLVARQPRRMAGQARRAAQGIRRATGEGAVH